MCLTRLISPLCLPIIDILLTTYPKRSDLCRLFRHRCHDGCTHSCASNGCGNLGGVGCDMGCVPLQARIWTSIHLQKCIWFLSKTTENHRADHTADPTATYCREELQALAIQYMWVEPQAHSFNHLHRLTKETLYLHAPTAAENAIHCLIDYFQ